MGKKSGTSSEGSESEEESEIEGLLDGTEDETEDEESEEESEEQDDDEEQDEDEDALDVDSIVDQLEQRLADRFDAVADRRVNALLKEIRKTGKKGDDDGDEPPESPVSETLVRAARLVGREYLTDEIKFLGSEERQFAVELMGQTIVGMAREGGDEEQIGRDAAKQTVDQLKKLRKFYERATVKALRAKGALVKPQGQPPKGGSSTTPNSEFEKGLELAKKHRGEAST